MEGDPEACGNIVLPLFNDTLGVQYDIISSTGDFRLRCVDHTYLQVCTDNILDREEQPEYVITLHASHTEELGCSVAERNVERHTEAELGTDAMIQSNQAILTILVGDVNDEPPIFGFEDYWGSLGNTYYIGIADNAMYGTSVYQMQASDKDLNSSLVFSISQKVDNSGYECYGSPEYSIDDSGALLVKDTLYTHLDMPQAKFNQEQAACAYDVSVTDVAADGEQFETVDAKIKILLVYEHIIISLDEPPEQVKLEVAAIVRCLADLIPEYVLFVEDVRPYLREETRDSSLINPDWTDIWLYAVNVDSKEFAKFWEFKQALFESSGWVLCIDDYIGIRRPSNIYYADVPYSGYALLAVAGFVAMAGLLCMFTLFISWDRMQADKARMLLQTGRKVNLAYEAESVMDAWMEPKRDSEPRLSIHSTGSAEKAQIQLWETESQELTMEMFNENEDFIDDDEVALIEPKSPTEIHILVGETGEMPFYTEGQEPIERADTNDTESTDEGSVSDEVTDKDKSDSDEVEGHQEEDGEQQFSPKPVHGLITFFEDTPETLPPPPTPPAHPRAPTPPPPPPPPPTYVEIEDAEFPNPPDVAKPVVFRNKEGETVDVVIISTEL